MGLFGLFGKKKKKRPAATKKASKTDASGERMDRLTRKGELPYGWRYENRTFIEKIEAEHRFFFDSYSKSRRKGDKQEYAALKSLILHMEDVQKLCKRKGVCFSHWASCIVANPKDIATYKARLKTLEAKLKTAKK